MESLYSEFAEAITGADHQVDLFGAALIIARIGGHPVDPHSIARQLDLIAEAALAHAGETQDPARLADSVDHQLFAVMGFYGNSTDYSDPENSYLDRVVERRTGLPITLSLVYMEVAQRVGLRCDGIGYPAHFIVRCGAPEKPIFVDPFHQGARLDREELLAGLRGQATGPAAPETFLSAVTRRQLLQRMLNNLHVSFRGRRDHARWLSAVEFLLRIEPWNAGLVGERGMLNYRLGNSRQALDDLERYVSSGEPQTVSAGALRLLDELRLRLSINEERP